MMEICVEYLADHPQAVPILAQWLFEEWGHRSPDGSVDGITHNLQDRLQRDRLPLALVALGDHEPIGTVSLKLLEFEIRPQYEHWLGSLYVLETNRRRGVGSLLVEATADAARRLVIEELYLYTRHRESERLYAGLGWTEVEQTMYRGRRAVIMKRIIQPTRK
jgi:GNAT superfamily N-acetyltransferase